MLGIGEASHPAVLILASKFDLSCDYVVRQLRVARVPYLRLNSEDLPDLEISLEPALRRLTVVRNGHSYVVDADSLRSVLFRRGVYLRDSARARSTHDLFVRPQWSAFLRALMVYEQCRWVNHPAATYRAETKPLQLAIAAEMGFSVPATLVTNSADAAVAARQALGETVVVKPLDVLSIEGAGRQTFGFASVLEMNDIARASLDDAPTVVQRALTKKTDLRVTVVSDDIFGAAILADGSPIYGDWRLRKSDARASAVSLPEDVAQRCVEIVKAFGLKYGAIDLAIEGGEYYFLELNPTGEWAWLVDEAGLAIDEAIGALLAS